MSLNPMQDPGNPANPNSPLFNGYGHDVPKRFPNTRGDLILSGILLGLFGVIIVINLLMQ